MKKNNKTFDQLISGYYGVSKSGTKKNRRNTNFSVSKSFDNGEVLAQKPKNNFFEYVVQSSIAVSTAFEEYIVPRAFVSKQSSVDVAALYTPTQRYTAAQEAQTDLTNPLQDDSSRLAMLDRLGDTYATRDTTSTNSFNATQPIQTNNQNVNNNTGYKANPSIQSSFTEAEEFDDLSKSASTATDDDFVRDMQAILTGQKVFDPIGKKTVDKSQMQSTPATSYETPSLPQMENKHAIFDQIAQSMEYAKAYDLGSIDLDKRFNDFDKIGAAEKNIPSTKKTVTNNVPTSNATSTVQSVGNEDFLKDLDAIAKAAKANKSESASATMATETANATPIESETITA